jgi:DNA-binding transcriptional regulator YhcF (GntR family)
MTVAEYAGQVGVSVQTVYRRLTSVKQKGHDCLTLEKNGKTVITPKGVELLNEKFNAVKQELNGVKQTLNIENDKLYDILQTQLEVMRADNIAALQGKDKLIDELRTELIAERQHNREQIDDLTAALVSAQALHAGTIQQQLVCAPTDEQRETTTEDDSSADELPRASKQSRFSRVLRILAGKE